MLKVETVVYHQASLELKDSINDLIQKVWPSDDLEVHKKDLNVQSFYLAMNHQVVSYAGVIQLDVSINNHLYHIGGLSCVATDPSYTKRGLSFQVVEKATKWMRDNLDFGIFTCKINLVDFYHRAGNWQLEPNVILVANRDKGALSSDDLDVVVMMQLFSEKAILAKEEITNSTIYLAFSKGQFI